MQKNTHTRGIVIAILALATTIADMFLKMWALRHLPLAESRFDFGAITFAIHKNEGVAFNIPIPYLATLIISSILILILIFIFIKEIKRAPMIAYGSLMIVIGALGNFTDRIINGFTTDYVLLFTRSAINLADIVIILGVLMIFIFAKQKYPPERIDKS